jgi:alkylation response protein AidB-like acyl-CoA dehydrogenase
MNFDLTEEQQQIQAMARDFARRELSPVAGKLDRGEDRATFLANLRKLAELGLMGINVRAELGGAEAGVIAFSLAVTEIARGCASSAVTMSVNNMVCEVIQAVGSREQQQAYIPRICSGEYAAGGFCLTEPGAGSDAGALRTLAVRDGSDWVLNGTKLFITSAEYAGVFVVWAVTDPSAPKGKGISLFLVENGTPGLQVGRAEHKMGQRASATNQVSFEDCRVPAGALMGRENEGFRVATGELAGGRLGVGSLALGIGQAALEYAMRYATERKQFGQPISNNQALQWMMAESHTELEAARLLLLLASFKKEQRRPFAREASMAKFYATEAAERACYNAVQILGGYGYSDEYPVERHYRDVRVTSIYEGTNQIQRMIVARDILAALK